MGDMTRKADGLTAIEEARDVFARMKGSGVLPEHIRTPEDAAWIVAYGRAVGMEAAIAILSIQVIEGKPCLPSEKMVALIMGSPVCEWWLVEETTPERATVSTQRRGVPRAQSITFTIEEAKAAGLLAPTRSGKPSNWQKYPSAMLRARATSALARMVYPDVLGGLVEVGEAQEIAQNRAPAYVEPLRAAPLVAVSAVAHAALPHEPEAVAEAVSAVDRENATALESARAWMRQNGIDFDDLIAAGLLPRGECSAAQLRAMVPGARRLPTRQTVPSASVEGRTYQLVRRAGGEGWSCTCTAAEFGRDCRHVQIAEQAYQLALAAAAGATARVQARAVELAEEGLEPDAATVAALVEWRRSVLS
jgi:hypothetical protein